VETSGQEFNANNVCSSDDDDLSWACTRICQGRVHIPYGPLVVDKVSDPLLKSKFKLPSSTTNIEYFFKELPSGCRECV